MSYRKTGGGIVLVCILINVVLIILFGNKINFYATEIMGSFSSYYLPIITSFTGILFYYSIMKYLSEKIGQNKYIDFISRNTFVILETHLFFINIPNFYAYYRFCIGDARFMDFHVEDFFRSAWFRYNSDFCLISFFVGLAGSLMTAFVLERVKMHIKKHTISKCC